jgi:TRAP-type C4-dicarboxylate transport system permease small subunit
MRDMVAKFMTVPKVIIGVLILFSIALNFANVIGRYVFFSSIIWAEEVMIFIMVWCVFIGAILVSYDGRHLKMDLLSANLKPPLKQIINAAAVAVLLICCGFVAVQSYKATSLFGRLGQESTVAGIPMVIPHAALLIGFVLIIIAVAVRFREHVSGDLDGDVEDIVQDFDGDKEP